MSIAKDDLIEIVSAAIGMEEVLPIDESMFRVIRREHGVPYAAYYIDGRGSIPDTKAALDRYQDAKLGPHYFDGPKALQWNSYLLFVGSSRQVESQKWRKARGLIENDRRYARKYVLPVNTVAEWLRPATAPPQDGTPPSDLLGDWFRILEDAGLVEAITRDLQLPARLRAVEGASSSPRPRVAATRRAVSRPDQVAASGLKEISLEKYRSHPLQKDFSFTKFNLIVGANGTGKTSLLDAIELLYCGRHRRDTSRPSPYTIEATFTDGRHETATDARSNAQFRARHLAWYGQQYFRSNTLCDSFGRFNYLDTDAAVRLMTSGEEVLDALRRLVAGHEASRLWDNIERLFSAVSQKNREFSSRLARLRKDTDSCEAEVQRLKSIREKLTSPVEVREQLRVAITSKGASYTSTKLERLAASLASTAPSAESVARLRGGDPELQAAKTRAALQTLEQVRRKQFTAIVELYSRYLGLAVQMEESEARVVQLTRGAEKCEQLDGVLKSGVMDLHTALSLARHRVATLTALLAGVRDETEVVTATLNLDRSVQSQLKNAEDHHANVERQLLESRKAYKAEGVRAGRLKTLHEQALRSIAEIVDGLEKLDSCPVCDTPFGRHELLAIVRTKLGAGVGIALPTLAKRQEVLGQEESTARHQVAILSGLEEFRRRHGIGPRLSMRSVLVALKATRKQAKAASVEVTKIEQQLVALRKSGFSVELAQRLGHDLTKIGVPPGTIGKGTAKDASDWLSHQKRAAVAHTRGLQIERSELAQRVADLGFAPPASQEDSRKRLEQIDANVRRVALVRADIGEWIELLPNLTRLPVDKIVSKVRSAQTSARQYLELKRAAGETGELFDHHLAQSKALAQESKDVESVHAKYRRAEKALATIVREYSLTAGLKRALSETRGMVEHVFTRIHSPREFTRLDEDILSLERVGGTAASLSQVSTGQRAAFALAFFLAQNAVAKNGPPVMLIDDPIAHIDDLNALSFLDYLRELAAAGGRQIFFATADESLASIIERKFQYLGGEFSRIDLTRDLAASG